MNPKKRVGWHRDLTYATTAFLLTVILFSCTHQPQSPAPSPPDPIRIGLILTLSGDLSELGIAAVPGSKLAAEQINQAGGILGRPLELTIKDSQTSPEVAVPLVKSLVDDPLVVAVVGDLASRVTIPVAQQATIPHQIVLISPGSTSPAITDLQDNDLVFRTTPSDALQGINLATISNDKDLKRLAIFYVDDAFGKGFADVFQKAFEAKGGIITRSLPQRIGQTDFRPELEELAQGQPEGLVLIMFAEQGVSVLKQAKMMGVFKRFLCVSNLRTPALIEAVGADFLKESFGTSPEALSSAPAFQAYQKAYEASFGELPEVAYVDSTYDAIMVTALAVAKAGSTDRLAVRDALRSVANPPGVDIYPGEWAKALEAIAQNQDIDYNGASGAIDFDQKGEVSGTFAYWGIENNEIKTKEVILIRP